MLCVMWNKYQVRTKQRLGKIWCGSTLPTKESLRREETKGYREINGIMPVIVTVTRYVDIKKKLIIVKMFDQF